MAASQLLEPYYRYLSLKIIQPDWSWFQKIWNIWQCYASFFNQRIDSLLFLLFGYYPFKTEIVGQDILDKYLKNGVIMVSIHSSSYPLAGKILKDVYPDLKIISPFFFHRQFSIFPVFQRFFTKFEITVVPLGGAMSKIGPALENNQSVCLFLDAELPVKHVAKVKLFKHQIPLTTGPAWLAKKYHKPVLPIYVIKQAGSLKLVVLPPINDYSLSDSDFTQLVGHSLEVMINQTLSEWQVTDRFLLPNLIPQIQKK